MKHGRAAWRWRTTRRTGSAGRVERPFSHSEVVGRYEDWYSTPYGQLADRIELSMLLELLRPVAPGASVLDLGCGTGHFAHALARHGLRVVGVDPEPAMLAVARERAPVVCGDGLHLPFADGAFDAAILVAVLKFVADPVALLAEARRVARERVVVLALASRSWLGLRRRVSGWLGHAVFSRATFRSRARIVELARQAGGEAESLRTALFLPPALAGRLPWVEDRLSRGALPFGGILGLALPGGAARSAPGLPSARRSSTVAGSSPGRSTEEADVTA